jgi:hypothetical protein
MADTILCVFTNALRSSSFQDSVFTIFLLASMESGILFLTVTEGRSAAVCSAAAPKLSAPRAALLILYIVKLSISKVYRQLGNS